MSNTAAKPPQSATRLVPGIAVSAIAGLAVAVVGLPSTATVFGTKASDLTVAAALFVALGGIAITAAFAARRSWRVVEIVVASVLGVAGGLVFAVWNSGIYPSVSAGLGFYQPAAAAVVGVWLLPGVLGGLVLRIPGAAVYTELVAAVLSALIGNQWGFSTVYYGLIEGLGAEVVLAVLLYRSFGLGAALAAGAGAGVACGLLDITVYLPAFSGVYKVVYVALAVLSGVVIAGLGSWALARALAATGVLAPLASGRLAERV